MSFQSRSRRWWALPLGLPVLAALVMGQGCPIGGGGGAGTPVVTVTAPSLDQTIPAGQLVTIVYSATSPLGGAISVSGFYDRDGVANSGDETTFATGLASGTNKFVQLSTTGLPAGVLYVGIRASTASGSTSAYAGGRITLSVGPNLTFSSPSSNITVGAGVRVPVTFNAGGGVTEFTYRLFFDNDGVFDGDEITIMNGVSSGSPTVSTEFDTSGLAPGAYRIGGTIVTTSGTSTAYAGGTVTVVSGAFVAILSPIGGITASAGSLIEVTFAASDPATINPVVRVFYDTDNDFGNGNDVTIDTVPASAGVANWVTASVPDGSYYVGAELLTASGLHDYSAGTVQLIGGGGGALPGGTPGTPQLTMRTPASPTSVSAGGDFTIQWSTTLRVGQGTIRLFAEPDRDQDGRPDGPATRISISPVDPSSPDDLDASTLSFDWDTTGFAGRYFIVGTVTPLNAASVSHTSPSYVIVVPPFFWVGQLATQYDANGDPVPQTGFVRGATFRGHNIGDNLGSAMQVADDFDGDGVVEVVLVSQFGKPALQARGGRGAGEAYLIYGQFQRYIGDFEVNQTGQPELPGVIFPGIVPNPNAPTSPLGNPLGFQVNGDAPAPFSTQGLRSLTLIPDQDNDGVQELVFGFPFCDSYSLSRQIADGSHPAPLLGLGRLENNGHFLRGGVVIVSSNNPLLTNRGALSRHFDRVLDLHEVGQVFQNMTRNIGSVADGGGFNLPAPFPDNTVDFCPTDLCDSGGERGNDAYDIAFFPGEGFSQNTLVATVFPLFGLEVPRGVSLAGIDPPRLADPIPASGLGVEWGELLSLTQPDPPPGPGSINFVGGRFAACGPSATGTDGRPTEPFGSFPPAGQMLVLGTGFYYDDLPNEGEPGCPGIFFEQYDDYCPPERMSQAVPPFGARILGQRATQPQANPDLIGDQFGFSVSLSGDFLLIGAPTRTATKAEVTALRNDPALGDRKESGEVYMLQLRRPGVPLNKYMWNPHDDAATDEVTTPAPHNYIIQDVGYSRCSGGDQDSTKFLVPGDVGFEMSRPFHIVGAAPSDHIGEVTGLSDINHDGVDDFAVGGSQTNGDRGAVYVIYRRQPQLEADYLLERLQLPPSDLNRLNGLMIVGRPGEELGKSIAAGGDFNDDGREDMIIGSPLAASAAGFRSGEVFLLFGGRNLLSPAGGSTIPELRDNGDGMVLAGARSNDRAGTTVANAGDVNLDGIPDLLIAAPNGSPRFDSNGDGTLDTIGLDLNGDRVADDLDGDGVPDDMTNAGLVYLVYGGRHLTGTISLNQIGSRNLPGLVLVGNKGGDFMGGGLTQGGLLSRGISSAGDLDGDGIGDFFISSILADPEGKTDAGEVYLVYGFELP